MLYVVHRLLLLGANPNSVEWWSPVRLSSFLEYSQADCHCDPLHRCHCRLVVMSDLLNCGAKVEPSKCSHLLTRSSENTEHSTRRLQLLSLLDQLHDQPPRLTTLAACVVRKCLAAAEFDGVIKNTDSLQLPSSLKRLLKLEDC